MHETENHPDLESSVDNIETGADAATSQGSDRKAKRLRILKNFLVVLGCLFFFFAGAVLSILRQSSTLRGIIPSMIVGGIGHGDPLYNWKPEVQFPEHKVMNVLILGCDHDYDNKDQIVKNAWGRSDSIMMARFDFTAKKIDALTIPRDTAVRIPGFRGVHKINAAHSYGGPTLSAETIKRIFGIESDGVIEVNFEGFQAIVDALDGIDLTVEKKLDYDDNWGNLHIHLKPGFQHMNGYQAMGYVRMRHSDTDQMRSKRQHNFIEAMRTKVKQPSTFGKLPGAVDRLSDSIKHYQMSRDQMFALINFARSLPKENINIETLPSFEGPSFVTVDAPKSEEVIKRMFFADRRVALNIVTPDPNNMREHGGKDSPKKKSKNKKQPNDKSQNKSAEPSVTKEPPSNNNDSTPETTNQKPGNGAQNNTFKQNITSA